jgi:phosphoserine phosphatase
MQGGGMSEYEQSIVTLLAPATPAATAAPRDLLDSHATLFSLFSSFADTGTMIRETQARIDALMPHLRDARTLASSTAAIGASNYVVEPRAEAAGGRSEGGGADLADFEERLRARAAQLTQLPERHVDQVQRVVRDTMSMLQEALLRVREAERAAAASAGSLPRAAATAATAVRVEAASVTATERDAGMELDEPTMAAPSDSAHEGGAAASDAALVEMQAAEPDSGGLSPDAMDAEPSGEPEAAAEPSDVPEAMHLAPTVAPPRDAVADASAPAEVTEPPAAAPDDGGGVGPRPATEAAAAHAVDVRPVLQQQAPAEQVAGGVLAEGVRERAAAAGLDVAVLLTLPQDILHEVLRERNIDPFDNLPTVATAAAPAAAGSGGDPATTPAPTAASGELMPVAQEFLDALASFPADVREDALLGVEPSLLELLPRATRLEAQSLRWRRGIPAAVHPPAAGRRGAAAAAPRRPSASRHATDALWRFGNEAPTPLLRLPRPLAGATDVVAAGTIAEGVTEGGLHSLLKYVCMRRPRIAPSAALASSTLTPATSIMLHGMSSPQAVHRTAAATVAVLVDLMAPSSPTSPREAAPRKPRPLFTMALSRASMCPGGEGVRDAALNLLALMHALTLHNPHFAECASSCTHGPAAPVVPLH